MSTPRGEGKSQDYGKWWVKRFPHNTLFLTTPFSFNFPSFAAYRPMCSVLHSSNLQARETVLSDLTSRGPKSQALLLFNRYNCGCLQEKQRLVGFAYFVAHRIFCSNCDARWFLWRLIILAIVCLFLSKWPTSYIPCKFFDTGLVLVSSYQTVVVSALICTMLIVISKRSTW